MVNIPPNRVLDFILAFNENFMLQQLLQLNLNTGRCLQNSNVGREVWRMIISAVRRAIHQQHFSEE